MGLQESLYFQLSDLLLSINLLEQHGAHSEYFRTIKGCIREVCLCQSGPRATGPRQQKVISLDLCRMEASSVLAQWQKI